ncbi:hypothetical protein PTKIN_Ptkin01aG0367500 [Pterospermum kingtungense]
MEALKDMKADLEMMLEEKIYIEARLIYAESALAEMKKLISEYKAMNKLVDNMVEVVIKAGDNDVEESNSQNLDEETMKCLIEEALRSVTESLNGDQTGGSLPAYDGSSGDMITMLNLDHGKEVNISKEACGGNKGGNAGGQAE